MKKLLLILMLTFSSIVSAETGTEELFGTWGTVVLTGKFGDSHVLWSAEGSARATDSVRSSHAHSGDNFDIRGLLGRAGIGYQLTPNDKIFAGYAYQYGEPPYARFQIDEQRGWQQYEHKHVFDNKDSLSFRSRLEERSIEQSSDIAIRFRQQAKYSHPLNDKYSLIASEEFFVNTNTVNWGPVSGFDQNRGFVGVGYKINDKFKTEVGYLNQYMNRSSNYDRMAHILSVTLYGEFI